MPAGRVPITVPHRPGRAVALVIVATVLVLAAVTIAAGNVLYPVVQPILDLTPASLGLFASIALVARAVCGPVWGILADRFGRARVLFIAALGAGLAVGAAGFAPGERGFIAIYSVALVCAIAVEPIVDSVLADLFPPAQRGRAFGVTRAMLNLGVGLSVPALGAVAAAKPGWRAALVALAGAECVGAVVLMRCVRVTPARDDSGRSEPRFSVQLLPGLFQLRSFPFFVGTYVLATSLVLLTYLPAFLNQVRGYPVDVAARLYGILHLGGMLGSYAGGWLGDWVDRRNPQRGRIQLMQGYLLLFALFTLLLFQSGRPGLTFDVVVLFAFGVVLPVGFSGCVLPMVSTVVPPGLRSTGFALLASFCQGLSLTLVSLVVGWLTPRFGLQRLLFWATTVPYALNAVLWSGFYRAYAADAAAVRTGAMALPNAPRSIERC